MIPFSACHQPNVLKVSILLYLQQLFFQSPSLQIHHTNPSRILISHHIHYNSNSISSPMPVNPRKKLLRLPHVFSQVLELPLRSNADVSIEDRSDCLRFKANIEDNAFAGQVRAHAVKIHPGVTKVVVRGGNGGGEVELLLEKLEVDVWRFRLPDATRPELSTAVVVGRELIVTVPKGRRSGHAGKVEDGMGAWGGRWIVVV